MPSCVAVSVEMSNSNLWGNLWSQDCNISAEWRKTVFHPILTELLNSSSLTEQLSSFSSWLMNVIYNNLQLDLSLQNREQMYFFYT